MFPVAARTLFDVVSRMNSISLEAVLARADLQTRVDRKYLLPLQVCLRVLEEVGADLSVLEVGHRRVFRYESVYFDTPDLAAYHQHAHGRRRRVKVRTRTYLDSGECMLEFKTVGGRGATVKERHPYPVSARHTLDDQARALAHDRVGRTIRTSELTQVLTTTYQRATLVDLVRGNRVTCDVNLGFESSTGGHFGPLDGVVVLESKTAGADSPVDRALRAIHSRPVSLSKYCAGMAVLDPQLPANRWNRELRTHFGWAPSGVVPWGGVGT